MMKALIRDVRYSFRTWARNPAFTIVAALTLALGIGSNTAIFTIVDALLLKTLPVQDPQQLVVIGDPTRVCDRSVGTPALDLFSFPFYRDLRDNVTAFTSMYAAATVYQVGVQEDKVSGRGDAGAVVRAVTANYFSLLAGC